MHKTSGSKREWDSNNVYHLKVNPERQASDLTAFEVEVLRLKLQPAQYQTSVQLREWVRKWCMSKYVPESLIEAWGMESLQKDLW